MRKLLSNLETCFINGTQYKLSDSEFRKIEKAINIGLVSENAFVNTSTMQDRVNKYVQKSKVYPLTHSGYELISKNIYQRIRESLIVVILRDFLLFSAFILSLVLTIKRFF